MNRIKEVRKMNRMSQDQLAKILHVHQTAVSQWETGKTEPDINNLRTMADLFHVTTDYLLSRDEPADAEPVYTQDDPEFWELREQLRRRPEMRTLFSVSKNATSADLKKAIKIIETLKGDDYDDPC